MYRKLNRKIKSIGLRNAVAFLSKRFFEAIFHSRNVLFTVDLTRYNPDQKCVNKEIEVSERESFEDITTREIEGLRSYSGNKLLDVFRKRLDLGHRFFLAHLNGEVAGARWVYIGGRRRFFSIPLSEKEFMCFAGFAIDRFRRRGVSTNLFIHIIQKLKQEGFQRGYVYTKEWNMNRKAITRAGFEFIGKFSEYSILNRKILVWSDILDHDVGRDIQS